MSDLRSEQSSSITVAGRVNRQSRGKTWPYLFLHRGSADFRASSARTG